MWPARVYPSCEIARNAKYAFLARAERKYARSVALICIVSIMLCLDTVIVLIMAVRRLRGIFTGKVGA